MLAALIRQLDDFALAEDALQDAVESALVHWGRNGLPEAPAGWLLRTAQRKAIDRLRRNRRFADRAQDLTLILAAEETPMEDAVDALELPDDRLRLIFTCCHPALAPKTRIALTLRTLGGLSTAEIARAFLDEDAAMAQRLVRARQKISAARIPYEVPGPADWPARLQSVLDVVYLIFNEGYAASSGATALRQGLCDEALQLATLLRDLQPAEPEIEGLLALLTLTRARMPARDPARFVPLSEQDRTHWDRAQIDDGSALVETALRRGRPGPYQLQAAISALHCAGNSHDDTDWTQIALLYDALVAFDANPVIALNRAVALSYAKGAEVGLQALLPLAGVLGNYRGYHAAEADLRRRLEQTAAARDAYERAINAPGNDVDTRFLRQRLAALPGARP